MEWIAIPLGTAALMSPAALSDNSTDDTLAEQPQSDCSNIAVANPKATLASPTQLLKAEALSQHSPASTPSKLDQ